MPKEIPQLYTTDMVQAILAGSKNLEEFTSLKNEILTKINELTK